MPGFKKIKCHDAPVFGSLTPQKYETVKSFARPEMKVFLFLTFFLSDFSLFYKNHHLFRIVKKAKFTRKKTIILSTAGDHAQDNYLKIYVA